MRITRDPAARLGGLLFVISGALVLANNYAPASDHLDRRLLAMIGTVAIMGGLFVWYLVPWARLPRRATLVIPAAGLALIGVANGAGGVSAQSYSAFFILVAAYIGTTQPRWTTLWFSVPITGVYMASLATRTDATPAAVWSVTVVVPVCVLVGEVIASALKQLDTARIHSDRRAELLAVTASAARAVTALDPKSILGAVADAAVRLGYDGVSVEVFDRNGTTYRCAESRGLPDSFTQGRQDADSGVTGEVRRQRTQVLVEGYEDRLRVTDELKGQGFDVVIGTPIWVKTEMVAVLNVGAKRNIAAEDGELEALELLAEQAGRALQLAGDHARQGRERRQFRRDSLVDELSGLPNRRRAAQLIGAARPHDVVAMLDLDDFKQVNQRLGHAGGDAVIAAMGELLRTQLRAGDTAARYGGEEFVLVMRRRGREDHEFFERLHAAWASKDPATTFSAGTAIIGKGESPQSALARADAALRRAKASGKSCTKHADIVLKIDRVANA